MQEGTAFNNGLKRLGTSIRSFTERNFCNAEDQQGTTTDAFGSFSLHSSWQGTHQSILDLGYLVDDRRRPQTNPTVRSSLTPSLVGASESIRGAQTIWPKIAMRCKVNGFSSSVAWSPWFSGKQAFKKNPDILFRKINLQ